MGMERNALSTWRCAVAVATALTAGTISLPRATPFSSNDALGGLDPRSSVSFNTTTGAYAIDGAVQPMTGTVSGDPGGSTMLFNFARITIASGVTVTAQGDRALGLLGSQDISILA